MSKKILAILVLATASFFVACNQEEKVTPEVIQAKVAAEKSAPIVKVDEFQSPSSPVIDSTKAKQYVKASAALVELGVTWSEKIDKAEDSEKVQILNAYNVARDQLCARVGLAGIAEFNWITKVALPNPQNEAVFKAAGLRQ
ncbi:MAG: hypothetical protein IKJ76_08910 [Fibrobacter sp.]|nr:hypothetical protein [Fibrobacter sp.]MBR2074900.1 hypothetical protein [Fibrobacter sp.]MBR3852140.1 hypothetical protein [Fibrobacter sp.]